MFDIGWSELLLIGIVALIVVGPKELPGLFRTVGLYMGRARGMAREFQRSMEQAADQSGLKEAADSLKTVNNLNLKSPKNMARSYADSMVGGKSTDPKSTTKPEAAPQAATEPDAVLEPKVEPAPEPDAGPKPENVAAQMPNEEAGSPRT